MGKKQTRRKKRGELKKQHERLYRQLHGMGNPHEVIQAMTLREALLVAYSSPQAVDAAFGIGVFQGIQEAVGRYAHWRKAWDRVQEDQARKQPSRNNALMLLRAQIEACRATGLSDREIAMEVQRVLRLSGWLMAS